MFIHGTPVFSFWHAATISSAIAMLLLIAGCATVEVPRTVVPDLEKSAVIVVEDLRPTSESQKAAFSFLITSSAYGIYRVAESGSDPTGPRLLAHRAYESLPPLLEASTFRLHHFVTYANVQSQLRKGALGAALGGAVGGAIAGQQAPGNGEILTSTVDTAFFAQTAAEEYRRANYSEVENPKKAPVNVIYIDTEMLGRRIATRCLVTPLKDKPRATLFDITDLCIKDHLARYAVAGASK